MRANRASADRTLGNDSALGAVSPRRRLLDHKAPRGKEHPESGVVEVAAISTPDWCGNRLEHPLVQANRVTAGAERQPVLVDSRHRG